MMRRQLPSRTMLGAMTLLVLCAAVCLALPVPMANPGAETVHPDRADRPADAGVYTSSRVDASFFRDTSIKRTGAASYYIQNRGRPDERKSAAQSGLFILTGDIVPGLTYQASGYIKTRDLTREAGFAVRLRSDKGWVSGPVDCDVVKGTNDWTRITASFTAPPGATQYSLFLIVRHQGEAWFDDIEMRDDLAEWSGRRFAALSETLARLQASARAAGAAVAAEDVARLAAARARAAALLRQSRELEPEQVLPFAARRAFADAAAELDGVVLRYARSVSVNRLVTEAKAAAGADIPFVAGFAPSTVHVFLEDQPVGIELAKSKTILAVRGETECVQLVILPHAKDLSKVNVTVSDLTGEGGVIPSDAVVIKPVGFVRTEVLSASNPYPRYADYTGWWPDPILDNFGFDVKQGESQPVWIEVHVPRTLAAGRYEGDITITAADDVRRTLGLAVEVADVTLPEKWSYENLLSWHEHWAKQFYGDAWNDALHEKFIEFLLERRINVISMYGNEAYETTENMIRFAKRGQNVLMLSWIHPEAQIKASKAAGVRRRLDSMIPVMKEAGVLDRCIVYGWDERTPEWYDEIRYGAEILLNEYGGMPLLSAGTDVTCGTDSSLAGLPNIIYCPHMPLYDVEVAARARANGNRVWWYDTWWIIEHPLIRGRLIPWQSLKVGADGFLFWCINRFVGNDKPVFDPEQPKIRTDWNPALDGGYENSTAMYIYPGRDGPVSSLRLENLRDGMEDYELLVLARDLLAAAELEGGDAAGIKGLRAATTLPDDFVKDHVLYSQDPTVLERQRRMLIKALEAALAGE